MANCSIKNETEYEKAQRIIKDIKNGVLLAPSDQDFITNIKEIEELGSLNNINRIKKAKVKLTTIQIAIANSIRPLWHRKPVTIIGGTQDINGQIEVIIRNRVSKIYTVPAWQIDGNRSIESVLNYGSDSNIKMENGDYQTMLRGARVNSKEAILELMNKLEDMDSVKTNPKLYKHLKKVISFIMGPMLRALPEMEIQVNANGKLNKGNFLIGKGIQVSVNTSGTKHSSELSAAQVFVHELIHAATVYALKNATGEVAHALNRLMRLKKEAMKRITPQDLMPEVSLDREIDKKIAQDRWNYINNHLEEFLAYAATHEGVINILSTFIEKEDKAQGSLLDKVLFWMHKMIDAVISKFRGEPANMKGDETILSILSSFAKAQTKLNTKTKETSIIKIDEMIDNLEEFAKKKKIELMSKLETAGTKNIKKDDPIWKKARWYVIQYTNLILNPKLAGSLEQVLTGLNMKPEGLVQTIIRQLKKTDRLANIAQKFGLRSVQIDEERLALATTWANTAADLFKKKLTDIEKSALQIVIQISDSAILLTEYKKNAIEFFKDDKTILNEIEKLYAELEKKSTIEEMNFYRFQARGLAKYIRTGKGNEVQLRNAVAIARLMGTQLQKDKVDNEIVQLIDKIASLYALLDTDKKTKKVITKLMEEDIEAVIAFSKLQTVLTEYVKNRQKDVDILNMRKGYIRELYDPYTISIIARVKDRNKMESMGYKYIHKIKTTKFSIDNTPMALYVSNDRLIQPFNKSAIRYVGERQQGKTLFESELNKGKDFDIGIAMNAKANAERRMKKLNNYILQGKDVSNYAEGLLTPEFDENGEISDFRYNVPLEDKMTHMGLELNAFKALGWTYAHQIDIEESEEQNEIVWEELLADTIHTSHFGLGIENELRNKEYVKLDFNSSNWMIRDIMSILPPSFKQNLKALNKAVNATDVDKIKIIRRLLGNKEKEFTDGQVLQILTNLKDGKLMVRRDMLLGMFGFRNASLTEMIFIKQMSPYLKKLIKKMENLWEDFVSLYKVSVIIKVANVFMDNFMSNFMYGIMTGGNPLNIANNYSKAWKELDVYIKGREEIIKLEALKLKDKTNKYDARIKEIQDNIDHLAIKPLLDYGLYTLMIEETETDTISKNRLQKILEEKTKDLPEVIKMAGNTVYMTEKTGIFKLIYEITAKSDFIARYDQFVQKKKKANKLFYKKHGRHMNIGELKKVDEKILDDIREIFINYTYPDNRWLQKMNDMGFVLFTKYWIRIQKVIMNLLTEHPIRAGIALAAEEAMNITTGIDTPDIIDSSAIFHGPFRISPYEMVKQVITPPIVREFG